MKKNRLLFFLLFLLVVLLGVFFRFYQLGAVPNSLDWDEVSWGYNAYAIAQTGADEHGVAYPLSFEGFGDYKQPLYIYADVLPIKLFGLNAFATRFPSAFFGSLSIIFVYLLVFELFKKEKYAKHLAFLSMFFFAISPWSIQFSRVAFEANTALFFVIVGVWLFVKGVNDKKNLFLFSGIFSLSLSAYTYHSEKVFIPLFFAALMLCYYRYFWDRKVLVVLLGVAFLLFNSIWIADMRTTARGRSVLFTSQQAKLLDDPIRQMIYDKNHGDEVGALLHNRRVVFIDTYIKNYLSHFNPNWLFTTGDNGRHHPPGMGVLYLLSFPFILIGIYFIKKNTVSFWILFSWLMLAPVASALAVDAPNASRSLIFLPTWHIFEAFGWLVFFTRLPKNIFVKVIQGIIIVFLIGSMYYFFHFYFVHTNTETQKDWQYGYKEAILYADKLQDPSKKIIFDNNVEQGYMFYLFYKEFDPKEYIAINKQRKIQDQKCFSLNNAYFGECFNRAEKDDLFVTTGTLSDPRFEEIEGIQYSDNTPAVTVYKHL